MVCPICRLESPPGALSCDCGYEFSQGTTVLTSQAPAAKSPSFAVASALWALTIFGSLAGGFTLIHTFAAAKGAPQQAAGAAMAIAVAVIPYCLARAVSELSRK